MKSVWNGKNKKILFLVIFIGMILLPGYDDSPTRPGEEILFLSGIPGLVADTVAFPVSNHID